MIRPILRGLGTIITLYIIVFVAIIYPNDARLSHSESTHLKPLETHKEEVKELKGKWPAFQVSLSETEYRAKFDEAFRATRHYLGSNFGIASPYLVNHSIGDYPDRLEGQQGILLPPGASVSFFPGIEGILELEFKATAIGHAQDLVIARNGTTAGELRVEVPPEPTDISRPMYLYLTKYVFVDHHENRNPWKHFKSTITLNSRDELTFNCKNTDTGFCFFSRPTFYRKSGRSRPNYLVILVDTLKQGSVNNSDAPVMANLKTSGREYVNTFAAGNLTSQSTNSFLSCQKPTDIGSLAFSYNMAPLAKSQFYKKAQPSFAHFFKRSGWKTAMIGNVSVISEVLGAGIDHGFEEQIAIEREAYDTPKIAADAVRWLEKNGDRPFFLYLHFHATHAPYRPPLKDIFHAFRGIGDLRSMSSILRWLYRGEVNYTDRYVGEVLTGLKQLGLADTTRIVLTADHGDHHQTHTFVDNKAGAAETGAFFDHGATLLNDEIHIPLIFSGFSFDPGSQSNHITSNLDIGPSLLDDAGIDIPDWCDGISLIRAERAKLTGGNSFDRTLGSEGIRQRAIYFGDRYKYTVSYSTTEKNLFNESSYFRKMFGLFDRDILIDLKADPNEQQNLVDSEKDLLRIARKEFDRYFRTQYLWELVLESPDLSEMTLKLDEKDAPIKFTGLDFQIERDQVILRLQGTSRGIATFDHPLEAMPAITSGGEPVPVLNTYARVNLHTTDLGLPVESIGEDSLLPVGSKKLAYLRKVAKTDFQERKIVAGNPQFEAILREWGYLNDN